jgi:hypothetical protein
MSMSTDPDLQLTRKTITRGVVNVEVHESDLRTDAQKIQWADKPNCEANVAGIKVPWKVWLGRLVGAGNFDEMVILSKKR